MKRKNIIIILSLAIIVILGIYVIKYNTGSYALATPAVNTPDPNNQSPTPASSPANNAAQTTVPAVTNSSTENYKSETVQDLSVTFKIPEEWQKISGYDNRFEGKSGFMELTAQSGYGLSLKEAVDLQINNEQKPFGDNPQIKNITIDSQETAIILPTSSTGSNTQSAILVKFPKPVTISATPYYYLIIWADNGHIEKIANEIKFIK